MWRIWYSTWHWIGVQELIIPCPVFTVTWENRRQRHIYSCYVNRYVRHIYSCFFKSCVSETCNDKEPASIYRQSLCSVLSSLKGYICGTSGVSVRGWSLFWFLVCGVCLVGFILFCFVSFRHGLADDWVIGVPCFWCLWERRVLEGFYAIFLLVVFSN